MSGKIPTWNYCTVVAILWFWARRGRNFHRKLKNCYDAVKSSSACVVVSNLTWVAIRSDHVAAEIKDIDVQKCPQNHNLLRCMKESYKYVFVLEESITKTSHSNHTRTHELPIGFATITGSKQTQNSQAAYNTHHILKTWPKGWQVWGSESKSFETRRSRDRDSLIGGEKNRASWLVDTSFAGSTFGWYWRM